MSTTVPCTFKSDRFVELVLFATASNLKVASEIAGDVVSVSYRTPRKYGGRGHKLDPIAPPDGKAAKPTYVLTCVQLKETGKVL